MWESCMLIIIIHIYVMMNQDKCSKLENSLGKLQYIKLTCYHKASTEDVSKWGYNGLGLDSVEIQAIEHGRNKIKIIKNKHFALQK